MELPFFNPNAGAIRYPKTKLWLNKSMKNNIFAHLSYFKQTDVKHAKKEPWMTLSKAHGRPCGECSYVFLVFCSTSSCFCSLPHGVETSFSRLLRHIMSVSSSLDLCVFAFSNMDLCRALLALHQKGVTIRVLADKDYAAITGSQIGVLRKAGRWNRWSMCLQDSNSPVTKHMPKNTRKGAIFGPYRDIIC